MKRYFYCVVRLNDKNGEECVIHGTADFEGKEVRRRYSIITINYMKKFGVPYKNVMIESLQEIDKEDWEILEKLYNED